MSRELLEEARKVVRILSGPGTGVRDVDASRAAANAQPARAAATGSRAASGVGKPRSSAVTRPARTQTAVTSRSVPAPPRITATPEPVVAAPTPREVVPGPETTAAPMPSPGVASVPEVVEEAELPEPAIESPPPEPAVVVPTPSVPEPAAASSEPPSDLRLDVASVCEELFNPKMMSYEANRLFEDRYKDATVRWTGTLRRASTYSYDFNFGDGGGTKAELDIYEVKQQYGSRTVRAFVQLPMEAADDIGGRVGEEMLFEGRLMICEGSARRLYIADARMVG